MGKDGRPRAGERIVLVAIPPGPLDGLPAEDQRAITAIVGKPVKFCGYDDIGRAELEFDGPFDAPPIGRKNAHFRRRSLRVIRRRSPSDWVGHRVGSRHAGLAVVIDHACM